MDVFELLLTKTDEERQAHMTMLVAGNATDFAEYKRICGVIRGLNLADEHIRDLAQRMKDNDDSD